jgi:hypothetical protein
MQMQPAVSPLIEAGGGGMMNLVQLSDFMDKRDERKSREAKTEKAEQEAKFEARLEAQRTEMQTQIEQLQQQTKPQMARDAIADEQLEGLQARLETLHEARLLTDSELEILEDAVVDCIEVLPTAFATERVVEKVMKMILITEKVANDKTLARQLRRKFA